jgi:crotonobetainyl-CoA:carnitine CoA-transferase CaiB-like acyl-CoA transferase
MDEALLRRYGQFDNADGRRCVSIADPVASVPSPKLGQHNREIYGDWLELSAAEIVALGQDGVI